MKGDLMRRSVSLTHTDKKKKKNQNSYLESFHVGLIPDNNAHTSQNTRVYPSDHLRNRLKLKIPTHYFASQ